MISLLFILQQKESFFAAFFSRINEGGPFFMFPILIMLLLTFFLIIKSVIAIKQESASLQKNISLLSSIGLLTLVWGILGQLIGLVEAFDKIEMLGEISTARLAGGLKISALPTMFGCLVFIISRASIIVFTWIGKAEQE